MNLTVFSGIGLATSLAAGIVSFLSPCVLPLVPAYVSYVAGDRLAAVDAAAGPRTRFAALRLSVFFVLGFSTVFVILGASATSLGQLLLAYRYEANLAGGMVVILFGLFMMGLAKLPWLQRELASDPNTREVSTITLSYTFFRSADPDHAKDLSRFVASAAPDPTRGATLFAERCGACHALDRNKTGPALAGIFGRHAAAAAGYQYSSALKEADLRWSEEALDRWLADPRKFVPGARMPVRVLDPTARRDIIAFLKAQEKQAKTAGTAPTSR